MAKSSCGCLETLRTKQKFKLLLFGLIICIVLIAIIIYYAVVPKEDILAVYVTIAQGKLRGRVIRSPYNITFASFKNIPYAKPPIGKLRFKDPVAPEPWNGIREATSSTAKCIQVSRTETNQITGSEDCLTLNVFTPSITPRAPLSVMVYVYGGIFMFGDTDFYKPDLFMKERVVMVTMNYRVGVFGFLSLNTTDVPGNAGMKDIVMALKWIKNNIKHFGGDAKNVTVLGNSSGAASVSLLQISPMARGLLHKVIAMSGSNLNDFSIQINPARTTNLLKSFLNVDKCTTNLLQELQNISAKRLWEVSALIRKQVDDVTSASAFAPIIEHVFDNTSVFLEMSPIEYLESGYFSQVPAMYGYTSYEYTYFYKKSAFARYMNMPIVITPTFLNLTDQGLKGQVLDRIREYFWGQQEFNPNDKNMTLGGLRLISDVSFIYDIGKAARITAKYSSEPTYYYRFSYAATLLFTIPGDYDKNLADLKKLGFPDPTHGEELIYLFPCEHKPIDDRSADALTRRRLLKLFTNFAKYGDPTPDPQTDVLPAKWLPITEESVNYLEISTDLIPGQDPDRNRFEFWNNLIDFVRQQQDERTATN